MNDINQSDLELELQLALKVLKKINLHITDNQKTCELKKRTGRLQKVLIANRGEIAKRFFLSLHEEGISTVAIVTDPDKGQSWYDFADEVVFIGEHDNYSNPYMVIAASQLINANAIYSGYGFLSENYSFVKIIDLLNDISEQKIIFMGPSYDTMQLMGDKISARRIAVENNIPLFESSDIFITKDIKSIKEKAMQIGYPVIIKLTAGGGGKGMFSVFSEDEIESAVDSSMRTGRNLYNNSSFYIEKLILKPIHIEVQIFNGWVIGIRKCAVQRRNQKIIEESGELFIDESMNKSMISIAEKIAESSGYVSNCGAGTIEFLIDQESGKYGFLEMNTRLQVEYAVTDQSFDIDLVKCQIQLYDGRENEFQQLFTLGRRLRNRNHAIECRIYAEDPENEYHPSPGIITELDLPTFNGIRCDFGFIDGDKILSMYDPMIGKLIVHGRTRNEALIRLERALQELYIKGVKTNVPQLLRIIRHPDFIKGNYTNNFLSDNRDLNPELQNNIPAGDSSIHVIMCAFAEFLRLFNLNIAEFIVHSKIKSIINAPLPDICSDFKIEYLNEIFNVKILQTSFNTFHTFINQQYTGSLVLSYSNDQADNIIVNSGNQLLRIRVDRKSGHISLRMKDDNNKIHYYNMKIHELDYTDRSSVGIIRSPFQGTIVSFCKNFKTGDTVSAGEPLIILSSMKMETTITADSDGRISYIIQSADAARTGTNKTADENKTGRSIQEGEILFKIEVRSREIIEKNEPDQKDLYQVFIKNFESSMIEDPEKFIHVMGELFFALICGYISQDYIIEMVQRIIVAIKFGRWKTLLTGSLANIPGKAIMHYTFIKKIFSTSITSEGISFYDELNILLQQWQNDKISLSDDFILLINKILESYGYSDDTDISTKNDHIHLEKIFIYLKFSHRFISEHPEFIRYIINILPFLEIPEKKILQIVNLLIENEAAERDNSLSKYAKKLLYGKLAHYKLNADSSDNNRIEILNFFSAYPEIQKENLNTSFCRASLDNPEITLIPSELNDSDKYKIELKINTLQVKYRIERLHSPIPGVLTFRLLSRDSNNVSYISFSLINGQHIGLPERYNLIEKAILDTIAVVSIYNAAEPGSNNWIHLLLSGMTISLNEDNEQSHTKDNVSLLSYNRIKDKCSSLLNRSNDSSHFKGIIECNTKSESVFYPGVRQLSFYKDMEKTVFEFLSDSDIRNPYSKDENYSEKDQKLFNLNKWPVELWAAECFDSGSFSEIKIKTVDYDYDPGNGSVSFNRVGAKIFTGKIDEKDVCFFMKDSRINSGSTGNLEGLKYVAASYLSILKGWPFFVWNDGAGANIKEGIIALNRGAEGFMMNTLQTSNDPVKFKSFIQNNSDPLLKSLFKSIDSQFDLSIDRIDNNSRALSLVAVGIGSSAGLDVYGSSQAVIQIMLDSDQSYRVLTGSNVIKSIIGEDIPNYDIGGAKIICSVTGTADIMASDKIQLVHSIRQIHKYFSSDDHLTAINRIKCGSYNGIITQKGGNGTTELVQKRPSPGKQNTFTGPYFLNITEEIIKNNVDDGEFIEIKKYYYESDSLIGGFVKIGGHRVMIIGARTHTGLSTPEPVIKARELLKISKRTLTDEIVIFGKEWIQPDTSEGKSLIYKIDFIKALQNKSGLRIHIITDTEGLKLYYINSTADIVIFIEKDKTKISESILIGKNSTFVVSSIDEAFDLSYKLLSLFSRKKINGENTQINVTPGIPADPSIPFDMITSVIKPFFDAESFVEFYREMNNSETGPTLITGMACLNGIPVGIIADQPLQKGGAADAYGTEKFRIFTQLMNIRKIPLIMLSNSSGFIPGSQQESLRIQAIGAESLDANILGEIPVVSVVFNQNYGGRLIHSFNKFLRPGIVYLAFPHSILAVIGVKVAFDLLNRKKYDKLIEEGKVRKAEDFKNEFYQNYMNKSKASADGISSGLVDWLIPDIKELRIHLIKGLDLAIQRCREAFPDRKN